MEFSYLPDSCKFCVLLMWTRLGTRQLVNCSLCFSRAKSFMQLYVHDMQGDVLRIANGIKSARLYFLTNLVH